MMRKYLLLTLISGILSSLAIPNEIKETGYSIIGLIAYIPIFICLIKIKTKKNLILVIILYFLISHSLQNFWLGFFHQFGFFNFFGVVFGYISFSIILGYLLYYALSSYKNKAIVISIFFTLHDYSRSIGFVAYPWGFAAFAVNNFNNLIQVSDIFGVFFISFIVYFFNASIAYFLIKRNRITKITAMSSLILNSFCFFYGIIKKIQLTPILNTKLDSLNVSLIQHNTDPWILEDDRKSLQISLNLTKMALKKNPETELVIWSEGVLVRPFNTYKNYYSNLDLFIELENTIKKSGSYFAIGAPSKTNDNNKQNSVYMIEPDLKIQSIYSKIFLVPFAEKLPFYKYKPVREFFLNYFGIQGQVPGTKLKIFNIKNFKFAALICYDDAFPELSRTYKKNGANIILNFSNDSWSKTKSAEWQHFVVAKFRSIENGIKTIRATNSGITSVINEYGEILAYIDTFEENYLNYKIINTPTISTIYEKIGDIFIYFLVLVLLIMTLKLYFIEDKSHLSFF